PLHHRRSEAPRADLEERALRERRFGLGQLRALRPPSRTLSASFKSQSAFPSVSVFGSVPTLHITAGRNLPNPSLSMFATMRAFALSSPRLNVSTSSRSLRSSDGVMSSA